ncbi:23S rRNA (adenine(2503)-C(2))-methyltransferase RlmN [Prochlorococcus sp. MIT 1300]|uniref:23S rRNA (adenine(2503)-C(2))-methyltransferase RlmN n=1 Tax=Prochlorococcus sp. MIT 1300 TaxID=3096218 RepID=UPI002A760B2F|nr:23S rRNA (adenine(2503)-C(2))-methyltransferase RlmN [Prochlorococcus sp. MIT 1300]
MSNLPIACGKDVLLGKSRSDLEQWVALRGEEPFRGRQLHQWLYTKGVKTLDEITVLPKTLRSTLDKSGVEIGRLEEAKRVVALDLTTKLLLETSDGEKIETVGIPSEHRLTVCVSSQVGCSMACRFCATGKEGLTRSLEVNEIVDQVLSVREAMNRRPSHIVFMGMGEPLLNIYAVLNAIRCFNEDLGISQRRITVSTVGVANTLPKLGELAMRHLGRVQFTLAVSLHAPNQKLREFLVPTAKAYPLELLLEDCRHYLDITGRRVSFEYVLLGGVNDLPEHAEELSLRVSGFQSHVNLIAYNPIDEEDFNRPSQRRINAFRNVLEQKGIAVSLRASRGLDQNAACGQLRRNHQPN